MSNSSSANSLGAIDYNQYQSWGKITLPSGSVLYVVPGTGYVYDPFLSQAKGRPVLWNNPSSALEKKKTDEKRQQQADTMNSPAMQTAIQVGVPIATATGAHLIANQFPSAAEQAQTAALQAKAPIVNPVSSAAPVATPGGAFQAGAGIAPIASTGQATALGSAANGGTLMTDGSTLMSDGSSILANGTVLPPGAGTAANAFQTGAGIAQTGGYFSGLAPAGSDFASMGTFGQVALPVAGALGAYDLISNFGRESKLGGFSSGAATGAAIGSVVPGVGTLIGAGVGGALGLASSFYQHKTTKQSEAENWQGLMDRGITAAGQGYADMHGNAATPGMTAEGKPWGFDTAVSEVKNGDSGQFRGVYGNYDTFGNDWATYTPGQQDAIVSALAHSDQYYSKKGDVLIKDQNKAREIKDQVLAGTYSQGGAAPVINPGYHPRSPQQMGRDLAARSDARHARR